MKGLYFIVEKQDFIETNEARNGSHPKNQDLSEVDICIKICASKITILLYVTLTRQTELASDCHYPTRLRMLQDGQPRFTL